MRPAPRQTMRLATEQETAEHIKKDPLRANAVKLGDLFIWVTESKDKPRRVGALCQDCNAYHLSGNRGPPPWWSSRHSPSCDVLFLVKRFT